MASLSLADPTVNEYVHAVIAASKYQVVRYKLWEEYPVNKSTNMLKLQAVG
jgi:hypothetical protein